MTRLFALIALLTALVVRPASGQTDADRAAVRQAVLDYAQALYRVDPTLIDRSVSADLVKVGVYGGDDGLGRVSMTFDGLLALAGSWNEGGRQADPASALARVTVLDVLDRTASARLDAVWGADYVHLAREPDGAWRIVHVLWQPLPDGPRAAAGPPAVRYALTPTSSDTLTTEAFDALPDQSAFSGVVADRWPNGRLKLLRSVVGGQTTGLWTEWYPSGIVRYLGQWLPRESGEESVGEGVWLYFHENGTVRYRETYLADRPEGVSEGWHPGGQKASEGRFRAGERAGRWRWWNDAGGLDSLRTYPDGGPAWTTFEPGVVSLPGIRETSPSVSADGRTLLFARTTDWENKVPYLATRTADGWRVERAAFADTVYNAALSPDGRTAFFQTHERVPRAGGGADGDSLVFRAFRSRRTASGWAEPEELSTLAGLNAGYFSVAPDGALTLFAWQPRGGLYRAEPQRGGYGGPVWLGDALAPDGATSYDALVHPDGDRLVVSRDVPEARRGDLGESGFYLYRLVDGAWTEDRRLPLPYGWGATVLPDGRFLFVLDGDLQTVPLTALGLDW